VNEQEAIQQGHWHLEALLDQERGRRESAERVMGVMGLGLVPALTHARNSCNGHSTKKCFVCSGLDALAAHRAKYGDPA